MAVKCLSVINFGGGWRGARGRVAELRTRQGGAARGRAGSYEVTRSRSAEGPGAADESFEGQRVRQPNMGSGRPRGYVASAGGAQVRAGLARDVALEAAHDLGPGLSLGGAALDIGAGG